MTILYGALTAIFGGLSAFAIFAMAFNAYSVNYQISFLFLVALASLLVCGYVKSWKRILSIFFIMHLPLMALLVMGSIEKGGWLNNSSLIVGITTAIWSPALVRRSIH